MISLLFTALSIGLLLLQMRGDKRRGEFNILNVSYLFQIYYIIQLPLSSCFAELFGLRRIDNRITAFVSNHTRLDVLILSFVGHLCFVLGSYISRKYSIKSHASKRKWERGRVRLLVLMFLLLGYFLFINLMRSFGGIGSFLLQMEYWRNVGLIGKGTYIIGIARVMPISIAIYMIFYKDEIRERRKLVGLIAVVIICFVPILVLGFRSYVFNVLITMVAVYHYIIRPIKPKFFAIGIAVFAVFFSFYSLARSIGDYGIGTLLSVVSNFGATFQKLLLRSRGSEVVSIAFDSINSGVGHRFSFDLITNPITNLIPRSIWMNKPESMTTLFPRTFFGTYGIYSGISPTCIGELYWEWGSVGVCIGMLIMGCMIRIFQNGLFRNKMDENHMITYVVFIWPITLLSETIAGALNIIVILIIVLFGIKAFLNIRIGRVG